MNFKSLLNLVNEATVQTGQAVRKEMAKGAAPDNRAKDAARKRAERARKIPHERQPKEQLIKEVIVVKTKDGKLQIIFKDSFNKNLHTKVTEKEVTMAEAQQIVKDPNFEQTRASILLFGKVKEGKKGEEAVPKKGEEKKEPQAKQEQEPGAKPKAAPQKARKLSKEEMFQMMSQMTPEQLSNVPFEMRQEFFKLSRKTVQNREFDHISDSYEELVLKFGINSSSNIPYNQQVLNALMFLSKIKVGASDQELQAYQIMAPGAMEFTKSAFAQARKLLSQLGDECLQNLAANVETKTKAVEAAGGTDMQCGQYRFKISAGGEISLSTNAHDQSNKSFRGFLAKALYGSLQQQMMNPTDEKAYEIMKQMDAEASSFGEKLISPKSLKSIQQNPDLVAELQQTPVVDSNGNERGFVLDQQGNLNPLANLDTYEGVFGKYSKKLVSSKNVSKSPFLKDVSKNILGTFLRGDGVTDPNFAPNHVVTANGVFPLSDDYMEELTNTVDFDVKPSKDLISSANISTYRSGGASMLKDYRTIIEAKQKEEKPEEPGTEDIFVNKSEIDPIGIIVNKIVSNNDFNFNASLLPGFKPKDLNTVEYNYVRIGNKTVKIPVVNDENPTITQLMGESYSFINDVLIESMTNNFVLSNLVKSELVTEVESEVLNTGTVALLESSEAAEINLKTIMENVFERFYKNPELLINFIDTTYGSFAEEYERDYKMEYRNYHGKAKQRKERAARTRARELMKKKGIVKKGDGKDIDHKKPLRSGGSNGINNLRVRKKSNNRSDNGHKKGEKQNKDWK